MNTRIKDLALRIYRAMVDEGGSPEYWAERYGRHLPRKARSQAIHSAIHWIRFRQEEQRHEYC